MVEQEVIYNLTKKDIRGIIGAVALQVITAAMIKNEEMADPENMEKLIIESLDKRCAQSA